MKNRWKFFLAIIFVIILIQYISAGELKVTTEHPFLINGSWIPASQLKVGDLLTTLDGKTAIIKSINSVNLANTFNVYNLEAGIYHDFVVSENKVVVHNSDKLDVLPEINTPDGLVPGPNPKNKPQIDYTTLRAWANSALTDSNIDVNTRAEVARIRNKLIDHLEIVGFDQFLKDLQKATEIFNTQIGNEPYVVVVMHEGKSNQWAYDLASQWLNKKPEGIVFITGNLDNTVRSIDQVNAKIKSYMTKGIKNYVIFDDATYSGTQVSRVISDKLALQYSGYLAMPNAKCFDSLNIYAVVSRASGSAENTIISEVTNKYGLKIKPHLIYGAKMENIGHGEILTTDEFKTLLNVGSIDPDQTLTGFDFNIPDSVSVPRIFVNNIKVKDIDGVLTPFREASANFNSGIVPYSKPDTPFYQRWLKIGSECN